MSKKRTTEEFIKLVQDLTNNEYIVMSEYLGREKKIRLLHQKCGEFWETRPADFLRGGRCWHCKNKNRIKTQSEFEEEVRELSNGEYLILSDYKGCNIKVKFKHLICGNIYETTPTTFVSLGKRCRLCKDKKATKTQEQFVQELKQKAGNYYEVIGTYITSNIPIEIKHRVCNSIYFVRPRSILNEGKGCPICKESKGESVIRNYLRKHNFAFVSQYRFPECRKIKPLPFDFAVFENNILKLLIEYDGAQHFYPIEFLGGDLTFLDQKLKDTIKTEFCSKNNIQLLRIPYWKFEIIEKILDEFLLNSKDSILI